MTPFLFMVTGFCRPRPEDIGERESVQGRLGLVAVQKNTF